MTYCYDYPMPAVTTDALLYTKTNKQTHILLIQRGNDPYKGHWALPGGFIEMHEDLATACERELKEETGIEGIQLKQFKTYGSVNRDPRGRTISVIYQAQLNSMLPPLAGDDAAKAQWFKLDQLPELAFDHQQIIDDFIREVLGNR